MYAVTWSGELLRRVGPNGKVESLGQYADGRLNCLAADKENRLYTIHSGEAPRESVLLEINTQSGEFHPITALSERLDVHAASFALNGRLLAIALEPDPVAGAPRHSVLYEIDMTDGACKRVGDTQRQNIEGLCLGFDGALYGFEAQFDEMDGAWGCVLIDQQTGVAEHINDREHAEPITSIAWECPQYLMATLVSGQGRLLNCALYSLNRLREGQQSIPGMTRKDIRGIEYLPCAASRAQVRNLLATDVVGDGAGVLARVREIRLTSSLQFGGFADAKRELVVEFTAQRDAGRTAPLVHPVVEVLEIRDQDGNDLSEFFAGSAVPIGRLGTRSAAYGAWTDDWYGTTQYGLAANPEINPVELIGLPRSRVTGLSTLRARVHTLSIRDPRTIEFNPDAKGLRILLRPGIHARLADGFSRTAFSSGGVASIAIESDGAAGRFSERWAPVYLLRAWAIGADGTAPPIECQVHGSGLANGGISYSVSLPHDPRGQQRAVGPDEIIRAEFLTEPDARFIDLTLNDIPL